MGLSKTEIASRLAHLKKELNQATLIAVTKYSPVEEVVTAYQAGQCDFGENRVTDLSEKADFFTLQNYIKVRWHFIGHLQSNKVRDLLKIPNLYAIHSIDSLRLLEELLKREEDFKGSELKIFFQVNTSHEIEKTGFENADELSSAIELILSRPASKLKFYGLMTMGSIRTENFEAEATRCFKDLAFVANNVNTTHPQRDKFAPLKLSMGMSQDYHQAIKEGSNFIRVGSAIFK